MADVGIGSRREHIVSLVIIYLRTRLWQLPTQVIVKANTRIEGKGASNPTEAQILEDLKLLLIEARL